MGIRGFVATFLRNRPASALLLPTLAFVLGTLTQATFLFFLVPAYAQAHGLGKLQLFAFAASATATMLVGVPAGRLADKVPRRRVMRMGWALESASALWLALAPPGVPALLLAAMGMGAGLAFGHTAFQSYVADVITGRALANGYGATSALAFLGTAAGPLAGALLLAQAGGGPEGVRAVALMLTVTGAAGALSTLALPTMRRVDGAPGMPPKAGFLSAVVQAFDPSPARGDAPEAGPRERRTLRAYAVLYAILGFGYGLSAPWFGPHLLERHGLSAPAWGALLGWSAVLAALATYASGFVGRRLGHAVRTAAVTNALTAASLLAFAFAPSVGAASAAFLARQLFGNATGPVLSTGLASETSRAARGRSFGLMNVAWNLPWALGAAAGGLLLLSVGAWTFVVGAAFLVAGPLAALALQRGRRPGATFFDARRRDAREASP